MFEQPCGWHGERETDPFVAERFAALERVQRARRVLDAETERARQVADGSSERGTATSALDADEVAHLLEIHRQLEVQRRAARRPFPARNGPEIMSLELAERLALERLGFESFAGFEAASDAPSDEPAVVDLVELARLEDELASAEAELARLTDRAELDAAAPLPRRPRRPVSPSATMVLALAAHHTDRVTSTRKAVFGAGTGIAPDRRAPAAELGSRSLFARDDSAPHPS